jgi:hypothetical protein
MDSGTEAPKTGTARRLLFPAALGAVGGAAAFVLTKKPKRLREAMPRVADVDVGELAGDLRGKLDSVVRTDTTDQGSDASASDSGRDFDANEIAARRRERQARRQQRRQSATT